MAQKGICGSFFFHIPVSWLHTRRRDVNQSREEGVQWNEQFRHTSRGLHHTNIVRGHSKTLFVSVNLKSNLPSVTDSHVQSGSFRGTGGFSLPQLPGDDIVSASRSLEILSLFLAYALAVGATNLDIKCNRVQKGVPLC